MKIFYDDGAAGAGKTTRIIEQLIAAPIRAIYCCERIASFDEIIKMIADKAAIAGTNPNIIEIKHSNRNSVKGRVEALADEHTPNHSIALITHKALQIANFDRFQEWSLIIDEVPSLLQLDHINTEISYPIFQNLYELTPLEDHEGWSTITMTAEGHETSNAATARESVADIRNIHTAVANAQKGHGSMMVRLSSWSEASKRKSWFFAFWFSFWKFQAFDRVVVLGNQFLESVDMKIIRKWDDKAAADRCKKMEWIALPCAAASPVISRRVTIRYFQKDHATKTKLENEIGQRNIEKIAKWLETQLPASAIYTANNGDSDEFGSSSIAEIMRRHIRTATYLSPKQAGSNLYRHFHAAAAIYTANASNDCVAFLDENGIGSNDWRTTKEHEAILQFVTRTSIRNPDSTTPVDFFVMDSHDAEFVADYCRRLGHDVVVEFADIGLVVQVDGRKNNGAQMLDLTPAERAARKAEQNRRNKQKQRDRDKAKKAAKVVTKEAA